METGAQLQPAHVYRFKPFTGSPHAWAIAQAEALDPGKPIQLLDVGAARGDVGLAIREARKGAAELTGVEIEPASREVLEKRYAAVHGGMDDLPGRKFDLALLLDVIEHTPDPVATLKAAARALRPGGTLLISVPNVAHWSVRFALLFGRFEYAKSGILDRTHLRFFTRRSFRRTLAEAGLTVEGEAFAVAPVELLMPSLDGNVVWRALRSIRRGLAWVWPGLLAFQLLARCRTGVGT